MFFFLQICLIVGLFTLCSGRGRGDRCQPSLPYSPTLTFTNTKSSHSAPCPPWALRGLKGPSRDLRDLTLSWFEGNGECWWCNDGGGLLTVTEVASNCPAAASSASPPPARGERERCHQPPPTLLLLLLLLLLLFLSLLLLLILLLFCLQTSPFSSSSSSRPLGCSNRGPGTRQEEGLGPDHRKECAKNYGQSWATNGFVTYPDTPILRIVFLVNYICFVP